MEKASARYNTAQRRSEPVFTKTRRDGFFSVQRKIAVGKSDDKYEREANSMADKVLQRLSSAEKSNNTGIRNSLMTPVVQNKCLDCEKEDKREVEGKEDIQKLDRKPIFESNAEQPDDLNIQKKCAHCDEQDKDLQKKESSNTESTASPSVESQLSHTRGAGSLLPPHVNRSMSHAFGHDFKNVRIHTGADAAQMSNQLNAQAFTHGNDIYFNTGKYDTALPSGKHLLAHELTHTIQQGHGSISKKIQCNGTTVAPPPGPPYKDNNNEFDPAAKTLKIDKIRLPSFKERNKDKFKWPLDTLKGRPPTRQVENWNEGVKSATNAKVSAFLNKISKPAGNIYFLRAKSTDYRMIGTKDDLLRIFYIPEWDRFGGKKKHEVDHILEMQLGGHDAMDNYELTDATANNTSGTNILHERMRRIRAAVAGFTKAKVPNMPKANEVSENYIVSFNQIDKWNLEFSGNGNAYWIKKDIHNGDHLNHIREMTGAEIASSQGSPNELVLYVRRESGSPLRLPIPFTGTVNNWLPGIDVTACNLTATPPIDDKAYGTISLMLRQDFTDSLKMNNAFTIGFNKTPGLTNTGYLTFKSDQRAIGDLLRFNGLSPIIIEEFGLDEKKGLVVKGKIKADLPVIENAEIDFSMTGKEIRLSKKFSSGEIKGVPQPLKVSDVGLTIFASTKYGFGVEGNVDFEISKLGKGSLIGIGATKEGFGIKGNFEFESEKFKGSRLEFSYLNKEWSATGTIQVKDLPGLKDTSLTVNYEKKEVTASGKTFLKIPKLDKSQFQLDLKIKQSGEFEVTGNVDFKEVPGVKSGTVLAKLEKTEADFSLSLNGEVEPNLPKVPNLNTNLAVSYVKGIFKAEAVVKFDKPDGIINGGELKLGITNGTVVDGELQGEGDSKKLGFYGKAILNFQPIKSAQGSITVKMNTDGVPKFSAQLNVTAKPFPEIDKKIPIFDVNRAIPLFGVPFLTLNAQFGVKADLYAKWIPLELTITGSILDKTYDEIANGKFDAALSINAKTSGAVGLSVTVKVGASATIALFIGGATINGTLAIEANGNLTGSLKATWSPGKGLVPTKGNASARLQLLLKPSLSGEIFVDLDLIFSKKRIWTYEKKLAEAGPKKLYELGINAPLEFDSNGSMKSFDPNKIKFEPALDGKAAEEQAQDTAGPPKEEKTKNQENTKDKIRQEIRRAMREGTKDQCIDIYWYASKLRDKFTESADEDIRIFVLKTIDEELKQRELDEFYEFKTQVLFSKDPISKKKNDISYFSKTHLLIDPTLLQDLIREVDMQVNQSGVQRKPIFESEEEHYNYGNLDVNPAETQYQVTGLIQKDDQTNDEPPPPPVQIPEPAWDPEQVLLDFIQEYADEQDAENSEDPWAGIEPSDEGPAAWLGNGSSALRKYILIHAEYQRVSSNDAYRLELITQFKDLVDPNGEYLKTLKARIDSVANSESATLEMINSLMNLEATSNNFIDNEFLIQLDGANAFPDYSWEIVRKLIAPPESLISDTDQNLALSKKYFESYWPLLAMDMFRNGLPVSYIPSLTLMGFSLLKWNNTGRILSRIPDQNWLKENFLVPGEYELHSEVMKHCVKSFAYYGVSNLKWNILESWKQPSAYKWFSFNTRAISNFRKEYPNGFSYLDEFYAFQYKGITYSIGEWALAVIFGLVGLKGQSPYNTLALRSHAARNTAPGLITLFVENTLANFRQNQSMADGMINTLTPEEKLSKSIDWSLSKGFAGKSINILLDNLDEIVLDILKEIGKQKLIKKGVTTFVGIVGGPLGRLATFLYNAYDTYDDIEDLTEIASLANKLREVIDEAESSKSVVDAQRSAAKLAETTVSTIPLILQILGSRVVNKIKKVPVDKPGKIPDAKRTKNLDDSKEMKDVDELKKNPEHLETELDTATGKVRESTESGYEVEAILPNGHIWRRNAKGVWCRFTTPSCILSLDSLPEKTRKELEELDHEAERIKQSALTQKPISKEEMDELLITKYPPGYKKEKQPTALGTFVHSRFYTKLTNWLDTPNGRDWLKKNKLTRFDFVLNMPQGNVIREFEIEVPGYTRKPRADVVDFDNARVHEIKPAGSEEIGFNESLQYAAELNKYHQRSDNRLWTAGPTITYDSKTLMRIFKKFGYFK